MTFPTALSHNQKREIDNLRRIAEIASQVRRRERKFGALTSEEAADLKRLKTALDMRLAEAGYR